MSGTTLVRLTAGARSVIVPATAIRKVVEARGVTPVPLTRPDVAGVMALDGRAVPVHRLADLSADLDEAAKLATREMIDFLVAEKNLSRDDAYILCSIAVDLRVTQLVDGTKGIHAMLAKSIFR